MFARMAAGARREVRGAVADRSEHEVASDCFPDENKVFTAPAGLLAQPHRGPSAGVRLGFPACHPRRLFDGENQTDSRLGGSENPLLPRVPRREKVPQAVRGRERRDPRRGALDEVPERHGDPEGGCAETRDLLRPATPSARGSRSAHARQAAHQYYRGGVQ